MATTTVDDFTADELEALDEVTKASALPPLDRSPKKNWVEEAGGLPAYIDKIARRLHANGMTISHAIAAAIETVKKWAAGGGNVKPDTRAKAAAAVAQWEKMKAAAAAKRVTKANVPVAFVDDSGEIFKATVVGDDIELEPWAEVDKAAKSYEVEAKEVRRKRRRRTIAPHRFKAGRWTTRKGIARCLTCGWGADAEMHAEEVAKRDFSADKRKEYAERGIAMADGSYPIPDRDALRRAMQAFGRAPEDKRPALKAHIRRRAKALGAEDTLTEAFTKALSEKDQASVDAETERIKVSREGPGSKPHKFQPAQWTHPNGHPRCRVCGQEEPVGGRCEGYSVTKDLGPLGSWTGADPEQDGVMVALFLHPDLSHELAVEGGEDPDALHITLAYMGKVDEQQVDKAIVARVVASVASRFESFAGRYNGLGRFEADDRGDGWPLVALPDIPGLSEFREALVAALTDVGVNVYGNHGFTAHTTLAYVRPDDEGDATRILSDGIEGIDVSFGSVCLAWGPDRVDLPFGSASGFAVGVMDRYDVLRSEDGVVKAAMLGTTETDVFKRYTLGPLYPAAPDNVTTKDLDAHGEFVTAPDIQEMVWDYVRAGDRDIRLQHTDGTKIGEWVELMCIPSEMTVPLTLPTGETLTKTFAPGTPFMGVQWTPFGWDLVQKGLIRGYSFGGTSEKMAVEVGD